MKLSIRARLLAAFILILVLACGQGLYALYCLRGVKANADEISRNWLPSIETANDMQTTVADFRIDILQTVSLPDPAARAAAIKDAELDRTEVERLDQVYVPLISSPQEQALHEEFLLAWKAYASEAAGVIRLVQADKRDEAETLRLKTMPALMARSREKLKAIIDLNHKGAADEITQAAATYSRALQTCLATMALTLVAGIGLAWRLSQDMSRRMAQAVAAADSIAEGELTRVIAVQGSDEITLLQRALARMQQQLALVVGKVRENAESVATASAQIAQGNADLSSRTEQQASALEETAASMEEINSTARQSADNAAQASQLALNANDAARDGGRVVGEVVQTMESIGQASREIVNIIAVIDGIAFQTNILALNAAVEAARAGEQGRGFAVVAGEVRSLAQRSAEAAQQIKRLIGTSVERVDQGTALVGRAGQSMDNIVGAIQRVSDIVGEMACASREQMAGVGQVSEAVTHMDQATQQNAALVEESAAAAESLHKQAAELVQAVAVFKLEVQAVRSVAPQAFPKKVEDRRTTRARTTAPSAWPVLVESGWASI